MPAQVQLFDQVTTFPPKTYIDTNYLLYLKSYPRYPADPPIYRSCKDFYDKMVGSNVEMYTSILSIQESIYVILYKNGICQDMKNFRDKKGNAFSKLSDFRKQLPAEFVRSYRRYLPNITDFMRFFYNLQVTIAFPKACIARMKVEKSKRVTSYAIGLLNKYELEPMDAFHVAIAKCLGIDHIVSTDKCLQVIDEINIFSYSLL